MVDHALQKRQISADRGGQRDSRIRRVLGQAQNDRFVVGDQNVRARFQLLQLAENVRIDRDDHEDLAIGCGLVSGVPYQLLELVELLRVDVLLSKTPIDPQDVAARTFSV